MHETDSHGLAKEKVNELRFFFGYRLILSSFGFFFFFVITFLRIKTKIGWDTSRNEKVKKFPRCRVKYLYACFCACGNTKTANIMLNYYYGLVEFYGISNLAGYLKPNPVYTYIWCMGFVNWVCRKHYLTSQSSFVCTQSKYLKYCNTNNWICLHTVKWLYIHDL